MPLLLCPNCNLSMAAVNRQGVEFDMCPGCRGVWLDRGELEKLVAGAAPEAPDPRQAQHPSSVPYSQGQMRQEPPRRYKDDDDDDHRRHSGQGYGQGPGQGRKKRFDLFDIFD